MWFGNFRIRETFFDVRRRIEPFGNQQTMDETDDSGLYGTEDSNIMI